MTDSNHPLTLEEAFKEISTIIEKMEQGELSLEQSLQHFERGIHLIQHSQKILTDAEQKVQILVQKNHQEELVVLTDKNEQVA